MHRCAAIVAAVALAALPPASAIAQPELETERSARAPEPASAARSVSCPRRTPPDYDGRPPPGPTLEESLLWVPRILFFPLHLVFEYVLRQPIGLLVREAERGRWMPDVYGFFTWDGGKAGILPRAFWDFGFLPSIGAHFFWNDLGAPGHRFSLDVGFGGPEWLRATLADEVRMGERTWIALLADAWRRPDYVFAGIGWDAQTQNRSRYERSYVRGGARLRARPFRQLELSLASSVTWNSFDPRGHAFSGPSHSLERAVANGWYDLPPGFPGYTAYEQELAFVIDTRDPRPAPQHGLRMRGSLVQAFDVSQPVARRWVRYGGVMSAFVDLGSERVLGLSGLVQLADPLGAEPVPFVEQVQLGGALLALPGFLRGTLIGRSGVVATLQYHYPIWVSLDGLAYVSAGNVFGPHFEDFAFERLRMDFGLGLRSVGDRDNVFHIMVALGTAPFLAGASVDSVRFAVGTQQGF